MAKTFGNEKTAGGKPDISREDQKMGKQYMVPFMHQAGLAHSDLSCNNVLVDPTTGSCVVIDIDANWAKGRCRKEEDEDTFKEYLLRTAARRRRRR